jgi:succinate dehydrogenase hydrophobic anchor subunit
MVFWGSAARPWVVLAVWLALSPFWIQRESLWIDEAVSAVVVLAPSLDQVWPEISRINATEMHLPAYHYYLWGVAHWVGHSEAALRAANLPWMLMGFAALILAVYARSEPEPSLWMALFLATNPFLFYYTNEVRPYAMQFGLACMAFAGVAKGLTLRDQPQTAWSWLMGASAVLLAWSTIYGLAWWLMCLVIWLGLLHGSRRSPAGSLITALLVLGGLSAASFHGWVISLGARASSVGTTNLQTLAYAACEWAGAAGFLPGRSQLRAGATPGLGSILMAAVTLISVVSLGTAGLVRSLKIPKRSWWPYIWSLPALGILASGVIKNFRVVGRHFTPIAPSLFWFLAYGPQKDRAWRWTRLTGVILVLLWISSDLRLATLPEHRKDDYRAAAHFIGQHHHTDEIVWWAADDAARIFYKLAWTIPVMNPSSLDLARQRQPSWVVLSKPDIYDTHGSLREFLARMAARPVARFQAFEIYRLAKP